MGERMKDWTESSGLLFWTGESSGDLTQGGAGSSECFGAY